MSLVDVRSPGEFAHAHIPGAINLPLFTDKERAEVGTLYKQVSQEKAFDLGLKFAGPKLESFVVEARLLEQPFTLYCARGGMRSLSMHALFQAARLKCSTLKGGYKHYRQEVLKALEGPFKFRVLKGLTGAGKTETLHKLREERNQIIDLEALANHKGSVFGKLGAQPSNEHFENLLAEQISSFDLNQPIWIEDESRKIGEVKVPDALYSQMQQGESVFISCSEEERTARLLRDYEHLTREELEEGIKKLEKKLGGQRVKELKAFIAKGDVHAALHILISYYDQCYPPLASGRSNR